MENKNIQHSLSDAKKIFSFSPFPDGEISAATVGDGHIPIDLAPLTSCDATATSPGSQATVPVVFDDEFQRLRCLVVGDEFRLAVAASGPR
jgi:hypothetical protein